MKKASLYPLRKQETGRNGIIVTFEDDGELTQYRVADVDFAYLPGCNTFPRTVDSEKLIVEE